jgi:hypothetical protein
MAETTMAIERTKTSRRGAGVSGDEEVVKEVRKITCSHG